VRRQINVFLIFVFFCRIISMKNDALSDSQPDEYLYGRSGYLYTLMFLRKEIRNDIIDKQLVIDVNQTKKNVFLFCHT
jgi:hypothetical protein